MSHTRTTPLALAVLSGFYLFAMLLAVSELGSPFPLFGRVYQGEGAQTLLFLEIMASLYLCIGILKRQRLSFRLAILYNFFDICNALINLALLRPAQYSLLAGRGLPLEDVSFNTVAASLFLALISVSLFRNRRSFTNCSPYLF